MIVPGTFTGVAVPKDKNGEPKIETALRKFKKLVKESGKLRDVYNNQEFKSKSKKRREVLQKAEYIQKNFGN